MEGAFPPGRNSLGTMAVDSMTGVLRESFKLQENWVVSDIFSLSEGGWTFHTMWLVWFSVHAKGHRKGANES